MKKLLLFVAMMLCCAMTIFAQNDKISYQAVVRDTENKLVANKPVIVTVNIFNGNSTQAAYTETHSGPEVKTNLNGLISLLVGNGTVTGGSWESIDWKAARIETTVTLNGVLLGTLEMPLTAVPYALYAKEISPDGTVVTNIYNKMQQDSADLAEKMRADSLLLHGALVDSAGNIRGALVDSTINIRGALVDSAINIRGALVDSTINIRGALVDSTINIRGALVDSAGNIRGALVDSAGNIRTALTDSVQNIDFRMNEVSTTLHNEITAVSTDMQTNYAKLAGANTFTGNNTFSGNNTFTGTVTAGTVNASSVTVTCGNKQINVCDLLDSCNNLSNKVNNLTNQITNLNNTISTLQDQIEELDEIKEALAPASCEVSVSNVNAKSMTLTASATSLVGSISQYKYCISTSSDMSNATCEETTSTSYTFENLIPSTTYYVTAAATNFAGTTTSTPVSQKTNNPVMTVSGNATATLCSNGTAVNYTVTIQVDGQTVSANDYDYSWSATGTSSVPGNTNSGAVTYTTPGAKIVTVIATHKTHGYSVTATRNTTVSQGVTSITLNKAEALIHYNNGTVSLNVASVQPNNAASTTYTWNSTSTGVATVNAGTVTAHSKGTANITVTANDACGASATCVVTTGVDLSTLTGNYVAQNNDILFGTLDGNTQKYKITIADNATVRLHNANINGVNGPDWAGITCNNATIILDAGTTNNVKGFQNGNAGIHVKPGYTLTIDGTGTLNASTNGGGAGIGGGYGTWAGRDGGNIIINGGNITATGGNLGSGIGNGGRAQIGNITINGGTIVANGGNGGAGIGCGQSNTSGQTGAAAAVCGNITITNNVTKVTANKGTNCNYSIGRGANPSQATCGTITIGGTIYWDGTNFQNNGSSYLSTSPLNFQP